MAYLSLYRKYRPQTFSDVVGQEHVTRTLQNAIKSGRIAHGYLFTGTRGTAKTTVARLLAKALNCDKGPAAEPCNACEACISVTAGSCIDVIEMDAASHRGVADIEEVRKAVGYGPMEFRYKVFIIDEAHQLSSDAKDAFLKTLEEPPDNVVFILATTEPQAIPITIRSRCQQFDFKRGSLSDIAARLRYVLEKEGVSYTQEAVNLVARGAEGSYRDSLSLLEQVLAYSPERITPADVEIVLGTLNAERLGQIVDVVARRDAPAAFSLAGDLLDAGKEARTLLRTLSGHFRDLLLVAVGGPAVATQLTPEDVARLQAETRHFTPPQMMRAMDILNEAQGETRWNNQHRLLVELTFLKLMNLGDGPAAAPFTSAPIVFSTTPASLPVQAAVPMAEPAPPVESPAVPSAAAPRGSQTQAAPASVVAEPRVDITAAPPDAPDDGDTVLPSGFFSDDESDEEDVYVLADDEPDVVAESVSDAAAIVPAADTSEDQEPIDEGPSLFDEPELAPAAPAAKPAPAEVTSSDYLDEDRVDLSRELAALVPPEVPERAETDVRPERSGPSIPLDDVMRVWSRFLREAEGISKQAAVMMSTARPTATSGKVITVTFSQRSNCEMMSAPKKQEFVRKLLGRCLGMDGVQVHFVLDVNAPPPPKPAPKTQKRPARDIVAAAEKATLGSSGYDVFEAPVSASAPVVMAPPASRETPPAAESFHTPAPGNGAPAPGDDNAPVLEPSAAAPARSPALDEPFVQEALSIFGGEVIDE